MGNHGLTLECGHQGATRMWEVIGKPEGEDLATVAKKITTNDDQHGLGAGDPLGAVEAIHEAVEIFDFALRQGSGHQIVMEIGKESQRPGPIGPPQ